MNMWWEKKGHLEVRENKLFIGGADAGALADKYGTPLYVTNEERVRENYRAVKDAYSEHYGNLGIHYAMKANSSLAVLKIILSEGGGLDVTSGGDIYVALKAGFAPEKLILTINTKSREELKTAIEKGIAICLDAESEVKQVNEVARSIGTKARVCFRINLDVDAHTHSHLSVGKAESKFGIPYARVVDAYKLALAAEYVEPIGMHTHIGSQIRETEPFAEAVRKYMEKVAEVVKLGVRFEFLDLGGGIGIPHEASDRVLTPKEVADVQMPVVKEYLKKLGISPQIKIEPGRQIVGDASVLLTRVQTIKQGEFRRFVCVDAGFNTLARPMLYEAYHEAVVAGNVAPRAPVLVDIAGNICESGDILGKERKLEAKEGDVVAFLCAGAYGMVMSSEYNSHPLSAEVLVRNGEVFLTRERGTYEDLLRRQKVPAHLNEANNTARNGKIRGII
ncbi:MAG: diaminopimelate decarboxylase [Candidatus Micrarchaeota archaeon]